MSDQTFGFLEGSSFANAINSAVEASLEEKRQAQLKRIGNNYEQMYDQLCGEILKGNVTIEEFRHEAFADAGII
jgi:hypothetical protein